MVDLPLIWAIILSFVVIMYVLLDGFDLGVGILFPFIKSNDDRDIMMSSISHVWDGNETWLVLGAACLYGAFPIAYSILLQTLYMPLVFMLAALIFRGVAFEFRFKANRSRVIWDISFAAGSTVAAFCQGLLLGTFIYGYAVPNHNAAHPYQWLTPFSVMTGIAVIFGYALLGANWLIIKTTNTLQNFMYRAAKIALLSVGFFMGIVSLWTPLTVPAIWDRWFSFPNMLYLAPLPILTAIAFFYHWRALEKRYEFSPFLLSAGLFILAYIGFCISDWPYIIPRTTSFWDAASSPSSQEFLLVGVVILLPVLVGYTIYAYSVFRGKVTSVEHHY